MSVMENVLVGSYDVVRWPFLYDVLGLSHRPERKARAVASRALDTVGFPMERRNLSASQLSLGEQKIVDIARAIACQPSILLMDEPSAGLGHEEMETLCGALKALRLRTGMTIILVAHHVRFVASAAEMVTVLDGGEHLASGPTEEVLRMPSVVRAFIGEDAIEDWAQPSESAT
jgi:ABC-type branched-subunit amino acid transport system ATPase component